MKNSCVRTKSRIIIKLPELSRSRPSMQKVRLDAAIAMNKKLSKCKSKTKVESKTIMNFITIRW